MPVDSVFSRRIRCTVLSSGALPQAGMPSPFSPSKPLPLKLFHSQPFIKSSR